VIHGTSGVIESGLKIFGFKIRKVREDVCAALAGSIEIKNVADAYTHPPDAWPAAALIRVVGDPRVGHEAQTKRF
jgi:hypothetical protein